MERDLRTTAPLPALPTYGINRDRLDALLRGSGGTVHYLRRTGEVAYSHPAIPERPRANGRRKDAPAHLVRFVRRVIQTPGGCPHREQAAPFARGR